ncbi:uncharacterized protein L203_100837 [Cryptococcus depauperatus CBS 7841]|uniref:Uncharacterized protein n=1 Tax=Cryptococcus depauperatus CBS 7841 TaxID=1295531 RepID=A0A1E3IZL8_9TREE|nr:transportin-3 [Cryptococcus depauperatus CBS 7841]
MAESAALQALQTLYHNPDTEAKQRANKWLEEFQHGAEAWQICHSLLNAHEAPLESRLFSAQTLRAKITYDLSQLPREQLLPLRDSLIGILAPLSQPSAPSGSRAVLLQLCLALSDLALQMPEWENAVGTMIDRFGSDPSTVAVLLTFLKTLPEEATNPRIPLTPEEAQMLLSKLVSGSAERVLELLTIYIQAEGVTIPIQIAVFEALRSWLQAGEMNTTQVAATPLFDAAFHALASDQLFDSAVDVICDLIHETQELQDNMQVVQQIIPRIVALRPELDTHKDDPDRVRGYCRILCEAGECYTSLVVQHPADLLSLVQAIAECAAYPDLDIVPITFYFWYALSEALDRQPNYRENPIFQPILDIFVTLQSVIIGHLHFPNDEEQQTAQEKDEFRTFRHRMGDTLKDCCHVLGASACLMKSYDLIVAAMSKPSPSWQEIEAPLFSMRSMGAEVNPNDDEVLPHIMDLLPKLPDHPKIRYAAILVISRYSQWINRHPDNLAFQLQYVSAGFEVNDDQVTAAAAHAMKFICQDCTSHLVPYLPQLYTFMVGVGDKLDQADTVEVCEAIGYIIDGMPSDAAAQALQQFCEPLIQRIQTVATAPGDVPENELEKASDALEQIDAYLTIVRTLEPVPETCYPTCGVVYGILDAMLAKYAKIYHISEKVGSVLRRGLTFFPLTALDPILPSLIQRMSIAFEETGYASYLWIIGKIADKFGDAAQRPGGEGIRDMLVKSFEGVTKGLARILEGKLAVEVPDVMDDYIHLLLPYLTQLPAIYSSPHLSLAISHTLQALTCHAPEIILVSLDVLSLLASKLADTQTSHLLQPIFAQYGPAIVSILLKGVVTDFPEDSSDQVQSIMGSLAETVAVEAVENWMREGLQGVAGYVVPAADKEAFLSQVHECMIEGKPDKVRWAIMNLVRAARRARERGRQARKSLGTNV